MKDKLILQFAKTGEPIDPNKTLIISIEDDAGGFDIPLNYRDCDIVWWSRQ